MLKNAGIRRLFIGLAIYIIIFLFLFINAANAASVCTDVIKLSWQPPALNIDGSEITDIDGYKVYYWEDGDNYVQGFDIGNVTSYQLGIANTGRTYYFAVTAYDIVGNESNYSNFISKTFSQ